MYIVAHKYKCTKCGHEEEMGGSMMDHWMKSPIAEDGDAVCPKCWNEFLKSFGMMKCTVAWNKDGSAYDRAMEENEN